MQPPFPAVSDPCAGVCTEGGRVSVVHPTLGPMEVVTYNRPVGVPGAAPSQHEPSYALYQNGVPMGYMAAHGAEVTHFGTAPAQPGQLWVLDNNSNVDRYGKVFLSSGTGVTVLTPTDTGYTSSNTMPGSEGSAFERADLVIDAIGVAVVHQKVVDAQGRETGYKIPYISIEGWFKMMDGFGPHS